MATKKHLRRYTTKNTYMAIISGERLAVDFSCTKLSKKKSNKVQKEINLVRKKQ